MHIQSTFQVFNTSIIRRSIIQSNEKNLFINFPLSQKRKDFRRQFKSCVRRRHMTKIENFTL
ncbi:uncharacterized protein DS421_17g582970 [Arachis hypogaea]|nr:uncharacterized protein DS421_17g582970 [Arachis hypogaea]